MGETRGRTEERTALLDLPTILQQRLPHLIPEELKLLLRPESSPSDLFTHLKLDQTNVNQLLKSQAFFAWADIVMSRHPDSYEEASRVMFETLSSRYKDDGALFRVLFEQQNIDDGSAASKLAARLLLEQIMIWGKNGKKSAEEVFMLLNLHEAKGELFESAAFRLWFSFVTVNDKKIRAKQFESMRTVLPSHYKGDGALFKALLQRLKIDDDRFGRKFAERMLRAQIESWGKNHEKTSEEVFTLFNLGKVEGELFESSAFRLWADFVTLSYPVLRLNKSPEQVMFRTLSIHYKDDTLSKALVARVKIDDGSFAREFAKSLLLKIWKGDGETVDDVFMLLNLGKVEGELFKTPAFSLWVAYVNSRHPYSIESRMFKTLSSHYKDESLVDVLVAAENNEATRQLATKILDIWIKEKHQAGVTKAQIIELLSRGMDRYSSRQGPA